MVKVKYNDRYLKRRYSNWATIELKLWLEELEQKVKDKTIEPDEVLCISPVRQEIERRLKSKENSSTEVM